MLATRGSKMEASKLILLIFTCILVTVGESEAKVRRGKIDSEQVSNDQHDSKNLYRTKGCIKIIFTEGRFFFLPSIFFFADVVTYNHLALSSAASSLIF